MIRSVLVIFTAVLIMITFSRAGNSSLDSWQSLGTDTVHIGNQVWMKRNLDVPMPNGYYYERDTLNNKSNGQLYFSSNALAACPKGWHLPSDDEWQQMINYLGGDSLALVKLLPKGSTGMNLTFAGYRSANSPNDLFGKKGEIGFYWTSTVKAEQ